MTPSSEPTPTAPLMDRIARLDAEPEEQEADEAIAVTDADVISDAVIDREADSADSRRPTDRYYAELGQEASD